MWAYTWFWSEAREEPFVHFWRRIDGCCVRGFNERLADDADRELLGCEDVLTTVFWFPLREGERDAQKWRIVGYL